LYIQHWEHADGHIWHYAGVTEAHNFKRQMKFHLWGSAYPRSVRARNMGFKIIHIQTETNADPWREKAMKIEVAARHTCELCAARQKIPPEERTFTAPLDLPTVDELKDMNFVPRWTRYR